METGVRASAASASRPLTANIEIPTKTRVTIEEMLLMAPDEKSSPTDSRSLVSRVMSLPSGKRSKVDSGNRCTCANSWRRMSRVA